ncbi:hypothetical protein ACFPM0_36415 [Pseudonocardia sulfidoxydans]|uniref:hypothetical protein n=1 Tax=Pseudonocardia sulfidoxydans TaxID=54011 RepID=UPI003621A009
MATRGPGSRVRLLRRSRLASRPGPRRALGSNGTYEARRVHARLVLGRGIAVGHHTVVMRMARSAIRGVTGRPRWSRLRPDLIAKDL